MFNRKSTFCVFACILALNVAVIIAKPAQADGAPTTLPPRQNNVTKEVDLELATEKTSSNSSPTSTSTSHTDTELPQGDEPAKDHPELPQKDQPKEPNIESNPEVSVQPTKPKETTTEPPLIHSETAPVPTAVSTSTTTTTTVAPGVTTMPVTGVQQGSTETTPSTTTKRGHSAATGLHAVHFTCLVASAMLVLLR